MAGLHQELMIAAGAFMTVGMVMALRATNLYAPQGPLSLYSRENTRITVFQVDNAAAPDLIIDDLQRLADSRSSIIAKIIA